MDNPLLSSTTSATVLELSAALFELRDALNDLALALDDLQFEADLDRRKIVEDTVCRLLVRIASAQGPSSS